MAVISNPQKRVKQEYISAHLLPDVAVLDVRMTMTLPPKVTASTGIDALCHAVEAYTCLQKNPMSDAYAVAAMALIRENLPKAVAKPNDKQARLAMANAQPDGGDGLRQFHGGIGRRASGTQSGWYLSCGPWRCHEHSIAPCDGV